MPDALQADSDLLNGPAKPWRVWRSSPQSLDQPLLLWNVYRTELRALNDRIQRPDKGAMPSAAEIQAQLSALRTNDWDALHFIEHRLVEALPAEELKGYAVLRNGIAARSGIAINDKLLSGIDALAEPELRARTQAILSDFFEQLGQRNLKHQSRRLAARRLARFGWIFGLPLAALIVLLALGGEGSRSYSNQLYLGLVVFLGAVGAYVSQLITFYGALPEIDYRRIENRFSRWSLALRFATGAFAAFVIYLLIAGHFLAGDLFPQLDSVDSAGKSVPIELWRLVGTGSAAYILPSVAFAKLLVWAFIAGFSERLLPDQLTRIESVGTKAEQPA